MATRRKYFGQAKAFKVYIGPKSVNLRLAREEGFILAEKVLRAANAGRSLDIAIYPQSLKGGNSQITVTSKD